MNKEYPTKKIDSAWLVEVCSDRTIGGIKNIIGIVVEHYNEELFYSIFDDCFFRILPFRILPPREELVNDWGKYSNRVFVQVYGNLFTKTVGLELFEQTQKDFLTIEELIANKNFMSGHYSDLDYGLKIDTKVDYENYLTIDENIIDSELDYREKLKRPITYDEGHIYGPQKKKTL